MKKKEIIEKKLGIPGDYQYKALRSGNFLQANWHNNKLSVIHKVIEQYRPKRVLDVGTGSGNFEFAFAKQVKEIVGLDYNDEALAFLGAELKKQRISNVTLIQANAGNIKKVKDIGHFDMIILTDVIEHIRSDVGERMIVDFKKLLTPSGIIVIITPNYFGLWPLIEKAIDRFTNIPNLENMQHVTRFTPNRLKRLFEKHNYKTTKATTFNTFSFLLPSKSISAWGTHLEANARLPFGNLLFYIFKSDKIL